MVKDENGKSYRIDCVKERGGKGLAYFLEVRDIEGEWGTLAMSRSKAAVRKDIGLLARKKVIKRKTASALRKELSAK